MERNFSLTLLAGLVLFLFSCEKIKDASTVDFDTTMSLNIPVNVSVPTASLEKSAKTSYSFSESLTESLEDNADINEYLDMLKSIDITKLEIIFSGLQDSQTIESITISVDGVGTVVAITNVTVSNLTQTPDISSTLLNQIAAKLYSDKQITITVSGTTNEAPMSFNVKTNLDLHIEASPL